MSNADYLDRPLPSDEDAETCVIGAVMLDNDVIDQAEILGPDDFYNPVSRRIWEAMRSLRRNGVQIDPITIAAEMKRIWPSAKDGVGILDSIGGTTRITNYTFGLPRFSDIAEYVDIVKAHAIRRRVVRIANTMTRDALAQDVPAQEILDSAEAKILSLNAKQGQEFATGFAQVSDIVPNLQDQLERYHAGETTGVPTGMAPLDHMLDGGGLQNKGLYVVGGIEKSGKTSLVLEWVRHITIEQGKIVPFVTLEMSKETLVKRIISMNEGIPYFMFRPGVYDTPENPVYSRLHKALEKFKQYPFMVSDSTFLLDDIKRYCIRVVENSRKPGNVPVAAIVIDYLQLIHLGRRTGGRTDEVAQISRELKMLASELDVPIIVLSSLNRVGLVDGQEPDTFNLRDSGSIAFDAEAVLFVHNPNYKPGKVFESQEVMNMNLLLSRQRNGPTGRIPLKFLGPYMSFMTETQYLTSFPNARQDIPDTNGQMFTKEQTGLSLWDENDDDYE